ncbi:MAG: hypothetical protein HC799_11310, partial [Limnothrix sp. RL_2_0]|nr:hypothetical protein [Limnothrix sp. RL_2_0]
FQPIESLDELLLEPSSPPMPINWQSLSALIESPANAPTTPDLATIAPSVQPDSFDIKKPKTQALTT